MNWLRNALDFVRERSKYFIVGGVSVVLGLGLAAAYASAVNYTSSLNFCAHTCHEMQDTVYQEYTHTKHFRNEQGVVVGCPQCHLPHNNWPDTFGHKFMATFELFPHFFGGYSDPKVFEKHRLELAKKVWAEFKANNAAECKACHAYSNMVMSEQRPSIQAQHADAMKTNENCLDCHKGITHKKFEDPSEAPKGANATGFDIQ